MTSLLFIHSTISPDISVENRILGQGASNHVTSEQQQQFGQHKHEQHRLKRCHKLLFSVEELLNTYNNKILTFVISIIEVEFFLAHPMNLLEYSFLDNIAKISSRISEGYLGNSIILRNLHATY